mgnify:FL=1
MSKTVNILYTNKDLNELNIWEDKLAIDSISLKLNDISDNSNKISARVTLIRSDFVIFFISKNILKDELFYSLINEFNDTNKKYDKPILFIANNSIDNLFDDVYKDEEISDEVVIKADDFKNYLSNTNVFYNVDDLLSFLGLESTPKKEEIIEELRKL